MKDPITALEILRDWNKDCVSEFSNLRSDDPSFQPLVWMMKISQENYDTLEMVISEMKKS